MAGIFLFGLLSINTYGQTNTDTLFVDGLCGMCKNRIEKAAQQVKGIKDAEWDIETRILTVSTKGTPLEVDQVHIAVSDAGHDTHNRKANDETYNQLHQCCKYRDAEQVDAHPNDDMPFTIFVNGACGMCKARIESTANDLNGVERANWDLSTKMLSVAVSHPDFDMDQIHRAVSEAGHDTKNFNAPDEGLQYNYQAVANTVMQQWQLIMNLQPLPSSIPLP